MNHSPAMRKLLCLQLHVFVQKKKKRKGKKEEISLTRLACCRRSRGRLSWRRWQSCSVEALWGEGIVGLGLVFFLVWSETCAPLPFPHPNLSLYYYRLARGAQRGARWAARCHSKPCVCCLERCVFLLLLCFFLLFFYKGLSPCAIGRPAWRRGLGSPGRVHMRDGDGRGPRVFQRVSKWRLDPATRQPQHKTAPLWVWS